jgi:hypothetical protein
MYKHIKHINELNSIYCNNQYYAIKDLKTQINHMKEYNQNKEIILELEHFYKIYIIKKILSFIFYFLYIGVPVGVSFIVSFLSHKYFSIEQEIIIDLLFICCLFSFYSFINVIKIYRRIK